MKEGAVPAAPHFKRDILTERALRLEHVRIGPHIGKLGQFTLTHIRYPERLPSREYRERRHTEWHATGGTGLSAQDPACRHQ